MFAIEVVLTWAISIEPGFGIIQISPEILVLLGGNVPVLVRDGELYRILTACFLHAGILHWLLNSVGLILFCAKVEALFPFLLFLIAFVIGGIQGTLCNMKEICFLFSKILSSRTEPSSQSERQPLFLPLSVFSQ